MSDVLTMGIEDIMDLLPHRYPFLLVDRVESFEQGKSIVAIKNVTRNEEFFQGHFPGKAVMPGVLIVEGLAQTAGILAYKFTDLRSDTSLFYLGSINEARFKRMVVPGDQLRFSVNILKRKKNVWKFECTATVDGELVCSAQMTCVDQAVDASKKKLISDKAIISPGAKIGKNVTIEPYAYIGSMVTIGDDCYVGPNAMIHGRTIIGTGNKFFQFSSIGADPQDKKFFGEVDSALEIGNNNIFREGCTVHCGTSQGGGITKIGDNNMFMVNTHIAHDCIVGNNSVFSNGASIAGHVIVGDWANLGGFVGVHQFCNIGEHSFCAGGSMISKDVAPYITVSGYPAQSYGLNTIGLERRNFTSEVMDNLRHAYKVVFRKGLTLAQAIEQLEPLISECPEVKTLVTFISNSERGIVR
jgi:UDP-N-acetylglucosamine acyltransferase